MLNKPGVAGVVFALLAAGLGFAAYFAHKWLTNGDYYLNIERFCDIINGNLVCQEFHEDDKIVAMKYLQVAVGPGLAFLAAIMTVIKLFTTVNCCVYLGAIKAFLSCAAFVTNMFLFSFRYYWTDSERDTYSVSWGMIMTPIAAAFALLASILMLISGITTRNQFGGKVVDAMQVKRSPGKKGVVPRNAAPRGGRRV